MAPHIHLPKIAPSVLFHPGLALAVAVALLVGSCGGEMITIGTLEEDLTVPETGRFTGLLQALKDGGYAGGENVRYQRRNAEARGQSLRELAQELTVRHDPALLLVFSPAGLEAATAAASRTLVVFALSGPDAEAVGREAVSQRAGIAGSAEPSPLPSAIALMQRLLPGTKAIGVLVAPGGEQEESTMARSLSAGSGADVLVGVAGSTERAMNAIRRFVEEGAGAVYLPLPLLAADLLPAVLSAADRAGIPVIAADAVLVGEGVLAGFEGDEIAIGHAAGALAAALLKGQGDGPALVSSEHFLRARVDLAVAARLGITVPPDLTP